jgi:hypothetical protein
MKQRQMPPVMHLEKTLVRPVFGIGAHPGDALALATLHFHDMGYRMLRPTVARLDFGRAAAGGFGAGIVAGLLKSESLHAEYRMIARHTLAPGWHGACKAITQHARVTGKEIDLMAGLQRQRIERFVDGQILQYSASLVPAPTGKPSKRRDMPGLAPACRKFRGG